MVEVFANLQPFAVHPRSNLKSDTMRATLGFLALAASALAGKDHWDHPSYTITSTEYETTTVCPITKTHTKGGSTYYETTWTTSTITVTDCPDCGGDTTVTLPDTTVGTTTEVEVTYTTICPITSTVTAPGETYTTTYTGTSVYVTKIETVIYETVKGPPVTKTAETEVYTTLTSLCPVTETKTVEGSKVVVTWTSTSTIVEVVPTTATEYTSYTVTEYTSTNVYETTTCPETVYTTVTGGKTIYITETGTEVISITKKYTLTETIPVTMTKDVDVTLTRSVGEGETVTKYPTVWITYSDTTIVTHSKPPATVTYPTTVPIDTTISASTTAQTEPATVPTAMAIHPTQAVGAVLAGVAGFMAML